MDNELNSQPAGDSKAHSSGKHVKKSKKHSKHASESSLKSPSGHSKSKRHKRSHDKVISEDVRAGATNEHPVPPVSVHQESNSSTLVATEPVTTEPIKKKKKRTKDESGSTKSKKADKLSKPVGLATAPVECPTDPVQKRSKKHAKIESANQEKLTKKSERPERVIAHELTTRMPDAALRRSRSRSSNAHSVLSQSSNRSRSYSSSPRHYHGKTEKPYHNTASHSGERLSRRSRGHSPEVNSSGFSHRPTYHRRITAGYRRASHSRENSFNELSPDRDYHRSRRSHSRDSHSSPRSNYYQSHSNRYTDGRYYYGTSNRPRILRPQHTGHIRSQSGSRRPRRDRDESEHQYEREYREFKPRHELPSMNRAPLSGERYTSSRDVLPQSQFQPTSKRSHSPRRRVHGVIHQSREHRKSPSVSPKQYSKISKHTDDQKLRSRGQNLTTPESSDGTISSTKESELPSRPSKSIKSRDEQDRPLSAGRSLPVRRTASPSSPSNKRASSTEKERKPYRPPALCSVFQLFDELALDLISDSELDVLLPVCELTQSNLPDPTDSRQLDRDVTHEVSKAAVRSNSESKLDAEASPKDEQGTSVDEQDRFHALETLEKLTSQIGQKLSGAESWDSTELITAELEDDSIELVTNPSLVAMATGKDGLRNRAPVSVDNSLSTPWQELIQFSSKDFSSTFASCKDNLTFVTPCVSPGLAFDSRCKLLPLKQRSNGSAMLRSIGISRTHFGDHLLDRLQDGLNSMSAEEGKPFNPTRIAWLHRCKKLPDKIDEKVQFSDMISSTGALSAISERVIRQRFLGVVL